MVVLEDRNPTTHPLRELSPTFDALYSGTGRPRTAPEKLLRALLLQVLYTIHREVQLVEQLAYNLALALVCRYLPRGVGVVSRHVHEEPPAAAQWDDGRAVSHARWGGPKRCS